MPSKQLLKHMTGSKSVFSAQTFTVTKWKDSECLSVCFYIFTFVPKWFKDRCNVCQHRGYLLSLI